MPKNSPAPALPPKNRKPMTPPVTPNQLANAKTAEKFFEKQESPETDDKECVVLRKKPEVKFPSMNVMKNFHH